MLDYFQRQLEKASALEKRRVEEEQASSEWWAEADADDLLFGSVAAVVPEVEQEQEKEPAVVPAEQEKEQEKEPVAVVPAQKLLEDAYDAMVSSLDKLERTMMDLQQSLC